VADKASEQGAVGVHTRPVEVKLRVACPAESGMAEASTFPLP
jgi:hypothetical protein